MWATVPRHARAVKPGRPFILNYAGEDNLIIGSDYSHADITTDMEALTHLQERTDIDPRIIRKILEDNPRALYSL